MAPNLEIKYHGVVFGDTHHTERDSLHQTDILLGNTTP